METNNDVVAAFVSDRTLILIGAIVCILLGLVIGLGFQVAHAYDDLDLSSSSSMCCDSGVSSSSAGMQYLNSHSSSPVTTIQPPVGLPSTAYRDHSGHITVTPPVGLPTQIYPSQSTGSPTTVLPPVGLPTYIYGR